MLIISTTVTFFHKLTIVWLNILGFSISRVWFVVGRSVGGKTPVQKPKDRKFIPVEADLSQWGELFSYKSHPGLSKQLQLWNQENDTFLTVQLWNQENYISNCTQTTNTHTRTHEMKHLHSDPWKCFKHGN